MIELEPWNPFAVGQNRGLGEFEQLSAVEERFQDVLLYVVIPVDDCSEFFSNFRQILDRLADTIIGYVIGSGFGSEIRLVSHILLDESILVMTADNRIGQIQIFNHGLQFSGMISADLTTEDDGQFVGLTDRPVRIHQSLAESIHGSPARKDQVVAKFDLREE